MWITYLFKYKEAIAIGLAVIFILGYIGVLKMTISGLESDLVKKDNVIIGYKVNLNKANNDIDRLSTINTTNISTYESMLIDADLDLVNCNESQVFREKKTNGLLDIITALKRKKPTTVTNTVYKLKECKVTISEDLTDDNSTSILKLLNNAVGGIR